MALAKGSADYRRLTLAMLFAGFSTFSLLYSAQPLLPLFAHDFHLSAEAASLAVGLATGPLAIGILVAGALSDRWGRRPMMVAAMFLAGGFSLATAAAPGWPALLALRFLTGVALAGVPAVAMAYVSEEVDHGHQSQIVFVVGVCAEMLAPPTKDFRQIAIGFAGEPNPHGSLLAAILSSFPRAPHRVSPPAFCR